MQLLGALHMPRALESPFMSSRRCEHVFLEHSARAQPNLQFFVQWRFFCLHQEQLEQANSDNTNSVKIYPWWKKKHLKTKLRKLTSRVMELAKRKQLNQGFGYDRNLDGVLNIVTEMKVASACFIDRVAYTAIIDACLGAGSTSAFAEKGDFEAVKNLHMRMIPECAGNPSAIVRAEADELLIEAAVNDGQAVVRLQTMSGFNDNLLSPYVLKRVSLQDPVEKIMLPYLDVNPLPASLQLCKVVMRFFRDNVVPVTDQWGHCIGIVHREDCNEAAEQTLSLRWLLKFLLTLTRVARKFALEVRSPLGA